MLISTIVISDAISLSNSLSGTESFKSTSGRTAPSVEKPIVISSSDIVLGCIILSEIAFAHII